jgi:hypothetical protein
MENEKIDLFDNYDNLPSNVKKLLEIVEEDNSYETCEQLVRKLNQIGYHCEYGLDASPHSLEKITISFQDKNFLYPTCRVWLEFEGKERELDIDLSAEPLKIQWNDQEGTENHEELEEFVLSAYDDYCYHRKIKEAKEVLKNAGYFSLGWNKADLEGCAGGKLTKEQIDLLASKMENIDCNIGISWESINEMINTVFEPVLFMVSGYYTNNNDPIEALFYAYDNEIGEDTKIGKHRYSDDDIFFYGMSELDLIRDIREGDNGVTDFVITSYEIEAYK